MQDISAKQFAELLEKNVLIVVDFWAEWCAPCKMMAKQLEDLSKKYNNKVIFVSINVDKEKQLADDLNIMSIPTVFLIKQGYVLREFVGLVPKQVIDEAIASFLNSNVS